jgi:uncharacterized membrane protein
MKLKKGIFWTALVSPVIFVVCLLSGGYSALAAGRFGHDHGHGGPGGMDQGGMGQQQQGGGFRGGHQMMNGAHHGGGFEWLGVLFFLAVAAVVIYFLVKWFRKKSSESSMQQFIDTSLTSRPIPVYNNNASILDDWEKSITTKKETE